MNLGERALVGVVMTIGLAGCSRSRLDKFHDALESGDIDRATNALADVPRCAELDDAPRSRCLDDAARTSFLSKDGFVTDPPTHGSAAVAAGIVLRERAGYVLPARDAWLKVLRDSKGTGADVLRLAVAAAMKRAVPVVTASDTSEASAHKTLREVAGIMPGACVTYRLLGEGKFPRTLPPEQRPEHSPCVLADVKAQPSPAPAEGVPRALAGAAGAWSTTLSAIRTGLSNASPSSRARLEKDLADLPESPIAIPTDTQPATPVMQFVHGHIDGGIMAADGGRVASPPPKPKP